MTSKSGFMRVASVSHTIHRKKMYPITGTGHAFAPSRKADKLFYIAMKLMTKKTSLYRRAFLSMVIAAACVMFARIGLSQSGSDRKSKQEKFGKSLDRLKWDSKKGMAVEKSNEKSKDRRENKPEEPGLKDESALKLDTLYVAFDITVTDPTVPRFVTGLGKDDFLVTEDGRSQQVATASPGDDQNLPRSIILIIDYSGSQTPYIEASIRAAKTLIRRLGPADEMAIVTDNIERLIDFTSDKTELTRALDLFAKRAFGEKRRGRTLQFSALFAALREMIKTEGTRPVIIFQTDGDEAVTFRDQPTGSDYIWNMPARQYGLGDIYSAAARSRATIYTIIPGEQLIGLAPEELYDRGRALLTRIEREGFDSEEQYLKHAEKNPLSRTQVELLTNRFALSQTAAARVAELTGGWTAFLEKPEQADAIYARILSDINNRYVVGYYPANTERDGSFRRVRIEVRNHPEYHVHSRDGYYAPGKQ